jgi:hypothetical protein
MPKHRRISRKIQKGGNWYNPMSWFNNSNTNAPKKSFAESITDVLSSSTSAAEGALNSATVASQGAWNKTKEATSKLLSSDVTTTNNVHVGGKSRKSKTMKGGQVGLGLNYYATPVSNMKVATPTYWEVYANGTNQYTIKGGSKTRKGRRNGRTTRRRKN